MRFKLFLICIISSETVFSQENLGLEYCNHLKFENYINKKAKFDSSFIKPFMDSVKNYFIKNNNLNFPEICKKNGNFLVDLNDLMQCYNDNQLEFGFMLAKSYVIRDTFEKDKAFKYLVQNYCSILEIIYLHKIYTDLFKMNIDTYFKLFDPLYFRESSIIKNEEVAVFKLIFLSSWGS